MPSASYPLHHTKVQQCVTYHFKGEPPLIAKDFKQVVPGYKQII